MRAATRLLIVLVYCIAIPWAVIMGITAGLQSGITVGRWCNETRADRIEFPVMPMEGSR